MITNEEIVDTLLVYKKKKRSEKGKKDNVYPLLSYYIMDVAYQVYCRDIKDLSCQRELKQSKRRLSEGFHKFNTDFFRAFNSNQTDYIIDQMDEFADYIHTSVVLLKSAIVEAFDNDVPFETKKTIAASMSCNVLAQAAQHVYSDMFRNARFEGEQNPFIESVKKASYDFSHYFPLKEKVDLTSSDKVMTMISSLCKKIVKFLVEKDNETKS